MFLADKKFIKILPLSSSEKMKKNFSKGVLKIFFEDFLSENWEKIF